MYRTNTCGELRLADAGKEGVSISRKPFEIRGVDGHTERVWFCSV